MKFAFPPNDYRSLFMYELDMGDWNLICLWQEISYLKLLNKGKFIWSLILANLLLLLLLLN